MKQEILDSLCRGAEYIPFLCMTAPGKPALNTSRLLETLIIALISGSLSSYVTLVKLETKMDGYAEDIKELRIEIKEMKRDFYIPLGRKK